jgi:hypothetical protein
MKVSTVLILSLAAAGVSSGAIISIDFGAPGNSVTSLMGAAETAGFVPAANWNSFSAATQAVAQPLFDDAGAGTGATVTWSSNNVWSTAIADTAGNLRMMKAYLDTSATSTTLVTLANIPLSFQATGYEVYVYYDGDNGGPTRSGAYTIGSTTLWGRDAGNTSFGGTFVLGQTATNPGADPNAVPVGNYLVFTGLSAASFVLSATPGPASDATLRAPINGVQIVQVPEPAALASLLLGATILGGIRRRRTA